MSNVVDKVDLPYNPDVLLWARERLGLSVESAARKIQVRADRIADWEAGNRKPTVRQARKLAKTYGRPFLEFFANERPNVPDVQLIPDFRLHRVPPSQFDILALEQVQRWAEEMRLNALDLYDLIQESPHSFPDSLFCRVTDDAEQKAELARTVMGFPLTDQLSMLSNEERLLPSILRKHFEKMGMLVLRQNEMAKSRARGICLYAEPLPVIVFGKEQPTAQAFTLLHEFGHVMLKASGISGAPRFGGSNPTPMKKIEGWCNRFAAAFLVPSSALAEQFAKPEAPLSSIDDHKLRKLARHFSISRHAMLIRLVHLGYVESSYYWSNKREVFIQEEEGYEGGGQSKYYGTRYLNSAGSLYTGLVLEAWESGRITNHNAAEFMGITTSLSHLNDIRDNFGG